MFQKVKVRLEKAVYRNILLSWLFKVRKSFNEDNGSNKVAYISYYMFLSLLPLLIVSLTIFDIVFASNPQLRKNLIESTFASIPVIGETLEANITFVQSRGLTLLITGLILVWASRAGANAIREALRSVFKLKEEEENLISKQSRTFAILFIISFGLFIPTFAQSVLSKSLDSVVLTFIFSLLWNTALVHLLFLVSVGKSNTKYIGSFIGGFGLTVIQNLSTLILRSTLDNQRPLYGVLAISLVLIAWITMQIRVLIFSAHINKVQLEE